MDSESEALCMLRKRYTKAKYYCAEVVTYDNLACLRVQARGNKIFNDRISNLSGEHYSSHQDKESNHTTKIV